MNFIEQFGVILLITVAFSFIITWLKQPIIFGYILSGLFIFFFGKNFSASGNELISLAELGITFLLFLMGLEFDLKNLKFLGKDIVIVTTLQSIFFFLIGFVASHLFGFNVMESVYLAILFMFSSTLIMAKWIEDKKEGTTLHGKIILGIAVFQDFVAIIALTVLNLFQQDSLTKILLVPVGGIVLVAISFIFAKFILRKLLKFAVQHPELLFIFSMGVCFMFVEISPLLGYSTTIGAFIAGITLANTGYKTDISARLKPLITFFTMLFFIGLGFQMSFNMSWKIIIFLGVFLLLNFLIKPIIFYLTIRNRGYDEKVSVLTSIYMTPLSEFGIIIIASGVLTGALSKEIATISIISVLATMILSSYLISADKEIYKFISERFGRKLEKIDAAIGKKTPGKGEDVDLSEYDVIFFGYYDVGKEIFQKLNGLGKKILVIENDPQNIALLKEEKIPHIYNSIANPYFFNNLNFNKIDLIVSSIIDTEETKMIIKHAKEANPKSVIIVTAKGMKEALSLYERGASYVIYPSYVNEQQVSVLLEDYTTDINKVITKKIHDVTALKEMVKKREKVTPQEFGIDWIFSDDDKEEEQQNEPSKTHTA